MSDQEEIEKMKSILKENDIEMNVGGCGCCGSPWIKFKYKGELIVDDDDNQSFRMINDEQ